jgi:hypothetical protein
MLILPLISFVFGNWKSVLIGGAIAAGLGWLAYEHHKILAEGAAQERQQIERANDEEMSRAVAAAKSVDACFAAGGTWDRDHGSCNKP